mgnify:CR=1 FL=1
MSSTTINIMYFVAIIICGIVMVLSPHTFMGRAKYDEGALKTQKMIKKAGIAVIVINVILIIYTLLK